jgi:uncharacterized membrane protein
MFNREGSIGAGCCVGVDAPAIITIRSGHFTFLRAGPVADAILDALCGVGNTVHALRRWNGHTIVMTEPAAARQLTTVLAFAYPILAHVAIARGSVALMIAAVAVLAVVMLLPTLARGSIPAWLMLPIVFTGCWTLSRSATPALALYIAPVLVPAFMAWAFGHTLARGRTPVIEQLIRLVHPPEHEPEAAIWPYARRLTMAWTILFVALAFLNLVLAALAVPDGMLIAAGITPPLAVPQEWWSWFANVIGYLIVAVFFVLEYAYRRSRFPRQPFRNMLDFLRRILAVMPRLLGRVS